MERTGPARALALPKTRGDWVSALVLLEEARGHSAVCALVVPFLRWVSVRWTDDRRGSDDGRLTHGCNGRTTPFGNAFGAPPLPVAALLPEAEALALALLLFEEDMLYVSDGCLSSLRVSQWCDVGQARRWMLDLQYIDERGAAGSEGWRCCRERLLLGYTLQ